MFTYLSIRGNSKHTVTKWRGFQLNSFSKKTDISTQQHKGKLIFLQIHCWKDGALYPFALHVLAMIIIMYSCSCRVLIGRSICMWACNPTYKHPMLLVHSPNILHYHINTRSKFGKSNVITVAFSFVCAKLKFTFIISWVFSAMSARFAPPPTTRTIELAWKRY